MPSVGIGRIHRLSSAELGRIKSTTCLTIDVKVPCSMLFDKLFFSIGAMKAATSWLYEVLKFNPNIQTAPVKEVHYLWHRFGSFQLLSREQRIATTELHIGGLLRRCRQDQTDAALSWFGRYLADPVDDRWFADLFGPLRHDRCCAEFSNMNALLGPEAWDHARSLARNLRLLYTIRNPAERMWSHARFQAQIDGCFDSLSTWSARQIAPFLESNGIVAHGSYSKVIARLRANFDLNEFLVCKFDDMRAAPASELRRIERFLGIRHHDYSGSHLSMIHNPSRTLEVPPAFQEAIRRYADAEWEALDALGIDVPADWTTKAHALHRRSDQRFRAAGQGRADAGFGFHPVPRPPAS